MANAADRADRTMESRDAELREYRYQPPENLPDPDPENGYEFRWVALKVMGQVETQNTWKRYQQGYEPVKPAEQVRLVRQLSIDPKADMIEFGGLQLCKIPVAKAQAMRAYHDGLTANQDRSAQKKFEAEAGPQVSSMPLSQEFGPHTTKGQRGFGSGK